MSIGTNLVKSSSDTLLPLMKRDNKNAESKTVEESVEKVAKKQPILRATSAKLLPKTNKKETKEIKSENLFTEKKEPKFSFARLLFKKSESSKESKPVNLIKEEDKPVNLSEETIERLDLVKNVIENNDQGAINELCKFGSHNDNRSQSIELSKEILRVYQNNPAALNSLIEKLMRCDLAAQTAETFFRNSTMSGILSELRMKQDPEMKNVLNQLEEELVGNIGTSAYDVAVRHMEVSDAMKIKNKKYDRLTPTEKQDLVAKKLEKNRPNFQRLCEQTAAFLFKQKLPENVRQTLEIIKSVVEQSANLAHLAPRAVNTFLMLSVVGPSVVSLSVGKNPLEGSIFKDVAGVLQKFGQEESTSTNDVKRNVVEMTCNAIKPTFQQNFIKFLTTNSTV